MQKKIILLIILLLIILLLLIINISKIIIYTPKFLILNFFNYKVVDVYV